METGLRHDPHARTTASADCVVLEVADTGIRHRAGAPGAHLRPVLQHQEGRAGHGAGPGRGLRHRQGPRRADRRRDRRRAAAPPSRCRCRWAALETAAGRAPPAPAGGHADLPAAGRGSGRRRTWTRWSGSWPRTSAARRGGWRRWRCRDGRIRREARPVRRDGHPAGGAAAVPAGGDAAAGGDGARHLHPDAHVHLRAGAGERAGRASCRWRGCGRSSTGCRRSASCSSSGSSRRSCTNWVTRSAWSTARTASAPCRFRSTSRTSTSSAASSVPPARANLAERLRALRQETAAGDGEHDGE